MPTTTVSLLLMLVLSLCHETLTSLHSKFRHFEELRPDRIRERVKRETNSDSGPSKTLSFTALGKMFNLSLTPGSPVLSDVFQSVAVDAEGKETPFAPDHNNFYSGFLNDNSDHGVDAVFLEGVWMVQINAPDDIYAVEPLRHHDPEGSPELMMVFKSSDIKLANDTGRRRGSLNPVCTTVIFKEDIQKRSPPSNTHFLNRRRKRNFTVFNTTDEFTNSSPLKQKKRYHRQVHPENRMDTCDILALADYDLYRGLGENSRTKLVAKLIFLYQIVDRTLKSTAFGSYENYGISVRKFMIYTQYSKKENGPYFNIRNASENAVQLLISMTSNVYYAEFCLAHLNTQKYLQNILGVATIADKSTWNNGICGTDPRLASRNVALTTLSRASKETNVIQSYALTVTHEIGHTWGSFHDHPQDPTCSPNPDQGGHFIMWPYYISPRTPNSYNFSPCSRRSIGNVLRNKAHRCFQPRKTLTAYCGNGIVDKHEDCEVSSDEDNCCQLNCRFKENAVCSPYHQICCTNNCRIAPPTQKCRNKHECRGPSFCSGTDSRFCPQAPAAPDNSTCSNQRNCWKGNCLSFCKAKGAHLAYPTPRESCTCKQNRSAMCMHCCKDGDGICKIVGGPLYEGTPCLYGFCNAHGCYEKTESTEVRNDLDKFIFELFLMFFLGSIVLLALLVSYSIYHILQKYCRHSTKITPVV